LPWFSDRGEWLGRFVACPSVSEVLDITKNYLDDVLVCAGGDEKRMATAKQKFSKRGLNFYASRQIDSGIFQRIRAQCVFCNGPNQRSFDCFVCSAPMGVASTETIRVNIVNNVNTPTAPDAAAPSCSGTIAFYTATGSIIGTATSFTIGNEQIVSASLPYSARGCP
jgi:hypothetical protein